MKLLVDQNVKNGVMRIIVDENLKLVIGNLAIYDYETDSFKDFSATAKCHPEDEFSEQIGIKIVKNKILRKYYAMFRNRYKQKLTKLTKELSKMQSEYEKVDKKYNAISSYLESNYELTFKN